LLTNAMRAHANQSTAQHSTKPMKLRTFLSSLAALAAAPFALARPCLTFEALQAKWGHRFYFEPRQLSVGPGFYLLDKWSGGHRCVFGGLEMLSLHIEAIARRYPTRPAIAVCSRTAPIREWRDQDGKRYYLCPFDGKWREYDETMKLTYVRYT
jgi:hypothetical protein